MTKEQVAATDAMVNMDTLGLGSTQVWACHADKQLTGALVFLAKQMNLPVAGANVDQVGTTDSEGFSARKTPASRFIHSPRRLCMNTFFILRKIGSRKCASMIITRRIACSQLTSFS
jgi:hypothetical protein